MKHFALVITAVLAVTTAPFACTPTSQEVKTVEQIVDVGAGICAGYAPAWAWVCGLSDTAIDQILSHLLEAKPGSSRVVLSAMDKPSKQHLLLELLGAQRAVDGGV